MQDFQCSTSSLIIVTATVRLQQKTTMLRPQLQEKGWSWEYTMAIAF